MREFTEKEQRKLLRLASVADDGEVAILDEINKLEDRIDELEEDLSEKVDTALSIADSTQKTVIRGEDGYTPKKGVDYFDGKNYVPTQNDIERIAVIASRKVKPVIVDKIIEKTEVIREIPVVRELVKETISTDTPENIIEKINKSKTLIDPNQVNFDFASHEGFRKEIDILAERTQLLLQISQRTNTTTSSSTSVFNEVVSGSGTTFTLASTPTLNSVRLYALGQRLVAGTDHSISGRTITTVLSWSAGNLIADYSI